MNSAGLPLLGSLLMSEGPDGLATARMSTPPPEQQTRIIHATPHSARSTNLINLREVTQANPDSSFEVARESRPSPSREQCLEDILERLTEAVTSAVRRPRSPYREPHHPLPLPEFRGLDYESAVEFVRSMEDHFDSLCIVDPKAKLALIADQLKGDAKGWFEPYRYMVRSYELFLDRLYEKYESTEMRTKVTRQLYGEKQKAGERASVFITKKLCLIGRVDRNMPERERVSVVLDLLLPEIRYGVRGTAFRTLEELVSLATRIEEDIKEVNAQRAAREPTRNPPFSHAPSRRPEERRNVPNQRNERVGPTTPCRYCPGEQYHYHRDCHNNPYRREGDRPGQDRRPFERPQGGQPARDPPRRDTGLSTRDNAYGRDIMNRNNGPTAAAHRITHSENYEAAGAPRSRGTPAADHPTTATPALHH